MTAPLARRDYLRAGVLTAVVPLALAFGIYWLAPWGCDANAWLCLLPIALAYLALPAALFLPIAVFLNRRRARPWPDGLIPVVLATGLLAQAVVSGTSLWRSDPHMREIFFWDVLIFPQGLAAGAILGLVFRLSLGGRR